MEGKIKKAIKGSKQGIWIVLILNIIANILAVLGTKNIVSYLENNWISIIYMVTLLTGLVLYKKEKFYEGAEVVQWAALGSVVVQFVQFITYYIITKLVVINFVPFLLGTLVPIILLVEALKVSRATGERKRSSKAIIVAVLIIFLVSIAQVVYINYSMNKIGSISSGSSNNNNSDEELPDNAATKLPEDVEFIDGGLTQGNKQSVTEQVSRYFVGDMSDVSWCSKQAGKEEKYEWGIYYYIQNEKVYYEYNNNRVEIKTIKGTPVKLGGYIEGGILAIKVLTSDGKVWNSAPFETKIDDFSVEENLEQYKIVDMGKVSKGENYEYFFYKTSAGKTIDVFGFELDVVKEKMVASYGYNFELYVGKDRSLSCLQGGHEQKNLKDITGMKAKRIYYNMSEGPYWPCYIVVDETNRLYEIGLDGNALLNVNNKVEVKEIWNKEIIENISYYAKSKDGEKIYFVEFAMEDGTVITYEIDQLYYNAETFNEMELN